MRKHLSSILGKYNPYCCANVTPLVNFRMGCAVGVNMPVERDTLVCRISSDSLCAAGKSLAGIPGTTTACTSKYAFELCEDLVHVSDRHYIRPSGA